MEKRDLSNIELVQKLLQSFVKSQGKGNFGFILSLYERMEDKTILLSTGCSDEDPKTYTILTDQLELMFDQVYQTIEENLDRPETDQERDDRQLGYN